jgi:hypothetical protein
MDMQQQLQQQTRNLFSTFPFPNFGAPPARPAEPSEKNPQQERGKDGTENKG